MPINNLEAIQKLYDDSGLLDVLISFEEYLDNMDLYVFKEWYHGEIVKGPDVSKYWVEVVLKFDADNPPDPRGALLFKNQGTIVQFKRDVQQEPIRVPLSPDDMDIVNPQAQKPKIEDKEVILVKFKVPRKLLDPSSSDEYNVIDAENMSNILVDREESEEDIEEPGV